MYNYREDEIISCEKGFVIKFRKTELTIAYGKPAGRHNPDFYAAPQTRFMLQIKVRRLNSSK